MKLLVDYLFCLVVFVILIWLLPILWILVKVESPGPAFFVQPRVGKDKVPFNCVKFRTMKQGTRQAGTHEIQLDNTTRIGRLLRRSKLDELPQVINLLKREMTLVGPRPCLLSQKELIHERDKRSVFAVLPGITGLAQVNKIDMSTPKKLAEWDARYIDAMHWSKDFTILLQTAVGSGNGDHISTSV